MDLAQLQQLITEGAAGQTANTVLSERMAEAQALRDAPLDSERRTGYVDPLSAIAGVIKNSKGRQGLRENRPQAEQALRGINELAAAKENYGLGLDAAATQQKQGNWQDTFDAGRTDADVKQQNVLKQALAREAENAQAQQNFETNLGVDQTQKALKEQQRLEEEGRLDDSLSDRTQFYSLKTGKPVQLFEDRRGNLVDQDRKRVDASLYTSRSPEERTQAARRRGAGGAGSDLKPTGSERKTYIEAGRLKGVIDELNEQFAGLSEEEQDILNQPKMEAAVDYLPAPMQRLVEEKMYDDPKVQKYKTRISRLESKLSQLASGLAVTGYEMKDRQKWSPNANGITQEERQRRLDNLTEDLTSEREAFARYYPKYTENRGGLLRDDLAEDGNDEVDITVVPAGGDPEEWARMTEDQRREYYEFVVGDK